MNDIKGGLLFLFTNFLTTGQRSDENDYFNVRVKIQCNSCNDYYYDQAEVMMTNYFTPTKEYEGYEIYGAVYYIDGLSYSQTNTKVLPKLMFSSIL